MSHAIRYPMTGAYRAAAELYAGLLAAAASAPDDDSARTLPEWRPADPADVPELYALAIDRTWRDGRWHVELKAPVQDHASPMMAMHGPERPADACRALVVFEPEPGVRSSCTIAGTRPRLLAMADTVRKNWGRYGGGPKPAELVPAPKVRRASWPAAALKVWREQIECKEWADVLHLGMSALGGRVYQGAGRAAFMVVAPLQVEGLPAEFASARRDDGQWVVFDTMSGRAIGQRGAGSRKAAEEHARGEWERVDPDRRARVVSDARRDETTGADDALAAWCQAHGIGADLVPADAVPVESEPVADAVPAELAPAAAPVVLQVVAATEGPAALPWQILAARPAATYCTPVHTIGVHEWACVVYTHETYGPSTDYVWRRVSDARAGGQYEGGRFFSGREWPTYDSNRAHYGQPVTLAKLYAKHQTEIRAALDAGRPAALQAWQAVALRAGVAPVATDAEAAAMVGACLARYGSTDAAACVHLASFAGWHADTLQQLRAAAEPEPAAAGAPAADPAPWRGPDNAAARARVHAVHVRTARTAAAVAPNWHADGARMRRSVNAPGFDAASRQLRAAVAAALRAERAAAAAEPVPVPAVAPADDGGFRARVEKAAAWIGTGRPTSRAFDSCFEMWDGAAVCVALLERAQRRPDTKLAANLWRYLARHHVEKVASERPPGLSLAEWSRQLVARSAPAELPPEPAPPAAPAAAPALVHPRMAEALAILAAAVQPVDPDAAADAAACADDALARVYGDAVADAVADAMAAAPPAEPARTARDGADDRAARLAALLVGIIGTDPARLAPALRRESARVAAAAESVPGRIADGYRRTARALADMATAELARAAPDRDTLAPDAPRPDPAALVAELDQITAAARDRMGGRTGSELSAMTPAELARRHAILQQLPTFAEERQAARQRIAARLAARQARPAPARAAPPAAGEPAIAVPELSVIHASCPAVGEAGSAR